MFNLRQGNFYWKSAYGYRTEVIRAKEVQSCDVLVVGAGISGALSAIKLIEKGFSVNILDEKLPASGSTTACTAILQYDTDLMLHELGEKVGLRNAEMVYLLGAEAVKQIENLASQVNRNVDFKNRPSLLLANQKEEVAKIEKEVKFRNNIGLNTDLLTGEEIKSIYNFNSKAALRSVESGEVDPVALTEAILELAQSKGAKIYSGCKVACKVDNGTSVSLPCCDNRVFQAKRVVFAAGYRTAELLNLTHVGRLTSSYAGCSEVLPSDLNVWKDRAVVWEVARPYVYLRRTSDNRVIIGGRDKPFKNTFLRDILLSIEKYNLEKKLNGMLDHKGLKLPYFWSGTFGESPDSLPYIGELNEDKKCFMILGTGGNGITFSMLAQNILADWLDGRVTEVSKLFNPYRHH